MNTNKKVEFLKKKLEEATGKKVSLKESVNPSQVISDAMDAINSCRVHLGELNDLDNLYDTSIVGKVNKMIRALGILQDDLEFILNDK